MKNDERYEVRNEGIERSLRTLGALLDERTPDGWAWGVFLVPFGEHEAAPVGKGAVFWMSNADRADMLKVVRAWAEEQEKKLK